ncbi:hypothetical protein [Actinotalea sp. K2]|uniref:hypothetical protein n=1 Tax=Actinotalea sp. K2 TaxID=2939438 RepID=UPI0020181D2C|nr:hypothetical protein [Actinotalea sp. K2]MCL3859479.1 hypothetical protein [Actinotalea sp. K2]
MTEPSAPQGALVGRGARFALFGEVLLVGVVVLLASLPLVTAVPAVAAGVVHLRRHLLGGADSLGDLAGDLVKAVRDLWPVGVLLPGVLLLLGYNLWLAGTGVLPGGSAVATVNAVVATAVTVVALRTAGAWAPGQKVIPTVRAAARRTVRDPVGSLLLVVAMGMCGVLVWMLTPLLLVVGGLLVLAVLAVENRWALTPP